MYKKPNESNANTYRTNQAIGMKTTYFKYLVLALILLSFSEEIIAQPVPALFRIQVFLKDIEGNIIYFTNSDRIERNEELSATTYTMLGYCSYSNHVRPPMTFYDQVADGRNDFYLNCLNQPSKNPSYIIRGDYKDNAIGISADMLCVKIVKDTKTSSDTMKMIFSNLTIGYSYLLEQKFEPGVFYIDGNMPYVKNKIPIFNDQNYTNSCFDTVVYCKNISPVSAYDYKLNNDFKHYFKRMAILPENQFNKEFSYSFQKNSFLYFRIIDCNNDEIFFLPNKEPKDIREFKKYQIFDTIKYSEDITSHVFYSTDSAYILSLYSHYPTNYQEGSTWFYNKYGFYDTLLVGIYDFYSGPISYYIKIEHINTKGDTVVMNIIGSPQYIIPFMAGDYLLDDYAIWNFSHNELVYSGNNGSKLSVPINSSPIEEYYNILDKYRTYFRINLAIGFTVQQPCIERKKTRKERKFLKEYKLLKIERLY